MRPSTPSTPISIPGSEHISADSHRMISGHNNSANHWRSSQRSGHTRSSSSSEDDDNDSNNFPALKRPDSFCDLKVGSLPVHLRRSLRSGRGMGQGQLSGESTGFFGPQSLPPPRAPILSSSKVGNISSIPDMSLPESALETDPGLSPVPYGSLRESKFAHPGSRFDLNARQSCFERNKSPSIQPQSLPTFPQNLGVGSHFNKKSSGIGSLLDESDEESNNQTHPIDGISLGCAGLKIRETDNQDDSIARNVTAIYRPTRGSETNYESAPLSSSLTALDILSQIRQSPRVEKRMATIASRGHIIPLANEFSRQEEQYPHTLHPSVLLPTRPGIEAVPSLENDCDHDLDTFGAFDFELDD